MPRTLHHDAPPHESVARLTIEVARLHDLLLASGDALIADLGLTSARWQLLDAVATTPYPLPVAGLARVMRLTRQAVQRVADDLERGGLVRFDPNPHHQRASLVVPTPAGTAAHAEASRRIAARAADLAQGLTAHDVESALAIVTAIGGRLAADTTA